MPHYKAREYALVHLKQMQEVTIHLYNLTVKHDWKFVWLNFQPFSHDNVYHAFIKFPKEPNAHERIFISKTIQRFDIPISVDLGYPGQVCHDRIKNQHVNSEITEPPIPLEPKEGWFWDNFISLKATVGEDIKVKITLEDPAPNVTKYLQIVSPVCYSVYQNLKHETKEVM